MKTKSHAIRFAAIATLTVAVVAAFSSFAAGPTSATAIDAKAGESVAAGRMVIPFDFGWRFHWGKVDGDPRAATFDDSDWRVVDLPYDAQFEQPWTKSGTSGARGFKPMGEMWYRKRFALSEKGIVNSEQLVGKRVFLELGGFLCVGDVYLNGKFVGSTDYGYLPVWADLTAALNKNGENTLAVWCSTGKTGGSRWYTGAGLYRDAKLVVKPEIAIARHGVKVGARVPRARGRAGTRDPTDGGSRGRSPSRDAVVSVTVELDGFRGMGGKSKLDVVADIKDAQGNIVATAKARAPWSKLRHQEVSLPEVTIKDVRLWDVDSPNLYTADVRLVLEGREIDRDAVRFGVRTVELDPSFGMKLNGRKVFLKSMSNHHDLGLVGAAAYRRAIRRQFETMKAFGYNAIRCSHNPYSEDFYDLADEMGVLVLDELIDKWSDKSWWFGRKPFTTIWPQLVTEWIKRDRNHPSVFAWSFGNELQMNEDLCGDFAADGRDLIYVRCRAVDANGVQVLSATNRVAFSCTGAARFLACDNGDHYTGELFTPDITAKNMKGGFILAAFRTGTAPGEATITISPEGLPEIRRTIKIGVMK